MCQAEGPTVPTVGAGLLIAAHRGAVLEFGHFRTAERCWEISQGYAFFAYPWNRSTTLESAPERVSRTPRTPAGVRFLALLNTQGYAENAYPWLISSHRSAVPKRLSLQQHSRF